MEYLIQKTIIAYVECEDDGTDMEVVYFAVGDDTDTKSVSPCTNTGTVKYFSVTNSLLPLGTVCVEAACMNTAGLSAASVRCTFIEPTIMYVTIDANLSHYRVEFGVEESPLFVSRVGALDVIRRKLLDDEIDEGFATVEGVGTMEIKDGKRAVAVLECVNRAGSRASQGSEQIRVDHSPPEFELLHVPKYQTKADPKIRYKAMAPHSPVELDIAVGSAPNKTDIVDFIPSLETKRSLICVV
eukprot:Hpha_TRINITY_DN6934_c0_g1::TRINITY_DN6934_c0_g1_i1::g.139466::m.139466